MISKALPSGQVDTGGPRRRAGSVPAFHHKVNAAVSQVKFSVSQGIEK